MPFSASLRLCAIKNKKIPSARSPYPMSMSRSGQAKRSLVCQP